MIVACLLYLLTYGFWLRSAATAPPPSAGKLRFERSGFWWSHTSVGALGMDDESYIGPTCVMDEQNLTARHYVTHTSLWQVLGNSVTALTWSQEPQVGCR